MMKLKEYKGVTIYVHYDGTFYCDAVNNSEDFKNKTFESAKLPSLEKAIDGFTGEKISNGKSFYVFDYNKLSMTRLQAVCKMGNRVFFDDGTSSADFNRRGCLYPVKSIADGVFSEIEVNADEYDRLKRQQKAITDNQTIIRLATEKLLKNIKPVSIKA